MYYKNPKPVLLTDSCAFDIFWKNKMHFIKKKTKTEAIKTMRRNLDLHKMVIFIFFKNYKQPLEKKSD